MDKSLLYTRTGDKGTTSLTGGERVPKTCLRLEAYGTIDELSSALGMLACQPTCVEEVRGELIEVQQELFNIGSYLATQPGSPTEKYCPPTDSAKIAQLEGWIDTLDNQTPKIKAFVLPGGCECASRAHLARTICRRAERCILRLSETEPVDASVICYVNRLSDYLFAAARYLNFTQGIEEIIWKK